MHWNRDVHRFVGHQIKVLRLELGMTQQQLAERVGTTYQQMHRYEKGIIGLSASRLFAVAQALNVGVADLFEGYDSGGEPLGPTIDLEKARILLNLMRALRAVDLKHQEAIARLVRALAKKDD